LKSNSHAITAPGLLIERDLDDKPALENGAVALHCQGKRIAEGLTLENAMFVAHCVNAVVSHPAQAHLLHVVDGQLFTSFHGRPESVIAVAVEDQETAEAICFRFNNAEHNAKELTERLRVAESALDAISNAKPSTTDSNDAEHDLLVDCNSTAEQALLQIRGQWLPVAS
jgi:hypothetical protein